MENGAHWRFVTDHSSLRSLPRALLDNKPMKSRRREPVTPSGGEEMQGLLQQDAGSEGRGQFTAAMTEVVVLKVALHCQGCARRVKKVLSKLQGVNTFHIDIDHQKVTVIGKVSPAVVLNSVTKVIRATEFWPEGEALQQAPAMGKAQQQPCFANAAPA